jgi:hypothetical protein
MHAPAPASHTGMSLATLAPLGPSSAVFGTLGQDASAGLVALLSGWAQLGPLLLAMLAVLFTYLAQGVSTGLVLGFVFLLRDKAKVGSHVRPGTSCAAEAADRPHHPLAYVSFLNKASIVTTLEPQLTRCRVLLDGSCSDITDHNVFAAIKAFWQAVPARAIGQVALTEC